VIHSSFYPEHGIGLWIAITSRGDRPPQGTGTSARVPRS
jgi:proline racemase